jgi:hypothetical protein
MNDIQTLSIYEWSELGTQQEKEKIIFLPEFSLRSKRSNLTGSPL